MKNYITQGEWVEYIETWGQQCFRNCWRKGSLESRKRRAMPQIEEFILEVTQADQKNKQTKNIQTNKKVNQYLLRICYEEKLFQVHYIHYFI